MSYKVIEEKRFFSLREQCVSSQILQPHCILKVDVAVTNITEKSGCAGDGK